MDELDPQGTDRLEQNLEARGLPKAAARELSWLAGWARPGGCTPDQEEHAATVWELACALAEARAEQREWVDWPSPNAWRSRSARLREGRRIFQWQALMILASRRVALDEMVPPPMRPDDLKPHHFAPWPRLEQCLYEAEDESTTGEPLIVLYETPDGRVDAVLGFSQLIAEGPLARVSGPSTLSVIRDLALELERLLGLRPHQAVAVLLADAPLTPPRLSVSFGDVGRSPGATLRVSDLGVTGAELEWAYRSCQAYIRSRQGQVGEVAHGYRKFLERWLKTAAGQGPASRTRLAGSRELVEFVDSRKDRGMSWDEILSEWTAKTSRKAASRQSLQANYYQAKKKLGL